MVSQQENEGIQELFTELRKVGNTEEKVTKS